MKKVLISFGTRIDKLPNETHEPSKCIISANANINICGGYGICAGGPCTVSKSLYVLVPDWVQTYCDKWGYTLCRPGFISKSGTDCLCFVECKQTAISQETEYIGSIDQDALLDQAISSGLILWYPTENGTMESMKVEIAGVEE